MDEASVREQLSQVEDPDLGGDLVSLGLVNAVDVRNGTARVSLALGAPYSPTETQLAREAGEVVEAAGVEAQLAARIPDDDADEVLPDVKNVIAVASGKGGVGKTTIATNLAVGLADRGASVGLLDADVYGPNAPRLLGIDEPPEQTADGGIVPPSRHGVTVMSTAFVTGGDDPAIWRGPMVHKVLTQLVEDTGWGELDYLVVDLPPGTGDAQLTVLQTLPLTGAVVVTTPQEAAIDDARRSLRTFGEYDTNVLGIVENMSGFRCPDCGTSHDVFDAGGGRAFAEESGMPFLGAVPLDPAIRTGSPAVLGSGDTADRLRDVVEQVADNAGYVRRRAVANV